MGMTNSSGGISGLFCIREMLVSLGIVKQLEATM